MHIPIGLPDSLDSLKTFVEAEGGFSPGVGSFGVSFWVYDLKDKKLRSPTMDDVDHSHGLADGRALIPWSEWTAGDVRVRTEVCEVRRESGEAVSYLVGARATLANPTDQPRQVALYVALRPVGPAGNAVTQLAVSDNGDALLVEGHPAIVADRPSSAIGVSPSDSIGALAMRCSMPGRQTCGFRRRKLLRRHAFRLDDSRRWKREDRPGLPGPRRAASRPAQLGAACEELCR